MFSDRHQLRESWFQRFDPLKIDVSQAVENFCPRASTTFDPRDSTWFRESPLLNFQLEPCADALILAEQCWETNLAQFLSSNWLTLWRYSKRVWHMHLMINLITSDRCFQLWLVASFFPQNRNCEYAKKLHWNSRDFKELRLFGLTDTFCRLQHLCLTIYLISRQRNHLGLKARNSDSNSVQPIR